MAVSTETANETNKTFAQWRRFILGDQQLESSCSVKREILDSWERCRKGKVDPNNDAVHHSLDGVSLQVMLRRNQEFIAIAKPFMENLYRIVAGSGFVVALTDVRGYIMEIFGDADTLKNPMTKSFFQGANWSEAEAGTNAIGTAMVIKKPVQVSGYEHYCRKHHALTCSAAPILDNQGNLLGILDVSGSSSAAHLHTLGMVVAAAEAIMAQLDIRKKNNELGVINKRLTSIFNTMSDGVIMVDENGLISELNHVAVKILEYERSEVELRPGLPVEGLLGAKHAYVRRMLKCKEAFVDVEIMLDTASGFNHCLASGAPVTNEQGDAVGGVIVLRPIQQVQRLVNRFSGHYGTLKFSDIVGKSKAVLEAVRVASLAAASMSNVLLQGESGTGKEIFAQAIHNRSDRSSGPFVAVNCGAIPRELIGSELFGYAEGAFTGAKRGGKPGKFELASGGTLFLDEIGDMPLEQQVVLLRVLQERAVNRIGCDKVIPVDVRVICATNKNLLLEVEKGTFRKDLYYRLDVISITIPPLRERAEDIVLLFNYFLERLDRHSRGFDVSPEVVEQIVSYNWPGNVRELQNVVERIVSLAEGRSITLSNLPREIRDWQPGTTTAASGHCSPDNTVSFYYGAAQRRRFVEVDERQEILAVLTNHKGNVSLSARELGISRNTLYRKMKQYSLFG